MLQEREAHWAGLLNQQRTEAAQQISDLQRHMLEQMAALQQQVVAGASAAAAAAVAAAAPAVAAAAPGPAATAPRGRLPSASTWDGTASTLEGWLREMQQHSEYYAHAPGADQVRFAAAHLRSAALDWWATLSTADKNQALQSAQDFTAAVRARFQPVNSADAARHAIVSITQSSKQTVHEYTSRFLSLLVAVPDMAEADKLFHYRRGLLPAVKMQVFVQRSSTLKDAISLATQVGSISQLATASMGAAAAGSGAAAGGGGSAAMELFGMHVEQDTHVADHHSPAFGPAFADASAPVSRADLQHMHAQLLAAMQQSRGGFSGGRGGGGWRSNGGQQRRAPIDHLSPAQLREYRAAGKCFGCGSTAHQYAQCPSREQGGQDSRGAQRKN